MFRRRLGGGIGAALGEQEAEVLRRLIREYLDLLDASDPRDPVNRRLFPPASLEDPEVDSKFRELAGDDLERHKRRTARLALESLGESGPLKRTLAPEETEAWLVLLTDMRLGIGVREGVTDETMEAIPDPNNPKEWPLALLHYLGALQESLVQALD